MTTRLPQIMSLEKTDGQVELQLNITKELIYFQGHFDEVSILPGVAQLDMAIQLASEYLEINKSQIGNISQIKFTHPIKPNTTLSLNIKATANEFSFRYYNDKRTYSIGKLKLNRVESC